VDAGGDDGVGPEAFVLEEGLPLIEAASRHVPSSAVENSPATGLANRRAFDQVLEREWEWERTQREGSEISLLLLDIDYFKRFNFGWRLRGASGYGPVGPSSTHWPTAGR
jgi:hypothetical protein